MSSSNQTTDHDTIREWAEARGGHPARVKGIGDQGGAGLLRIDFGEPEPNLEEISWEDFFETFEESGLAFLYQDKEESRFNKLIQRD